MAAAMGPAPGAWRSGGVARDLAHLSTCLVQVRTAWRTEDDLQAVVLEHLAAAGIPAVREVRLNRRDRIDLIATVGDVGIGIEVKIGGTVGVVARQLQRYGHHADRFGGLLLVTSKPRHAQLPDTIAGMPVRVCLVQAGAW